MIIGYMNKKSTIVASSQFVYLFGAINRIAVGSLHIVILLLVIIMEHAF